MSGLIKFGTIINIIRWSFSIIFFPTTIYTISKLRAQEIIVYSTG